MPSFSTVPLFHTLITFLPLHNRRIDWKQLTARLIGQETMFSLSAPGRERRESWVPFLTVTRAKSSQTFSSCPQPAASPLARTRLRSVPFVSFLHCPFLQREDFGAGALHSRLGWIYSTLPQLKIHCSPTQIHRSLCRWPD